VQGKQFQLLPFTHCDFSSDLWRQNVFGRVFGCELSKLLKLSILILTIYVYCRFRDFGVIFQGMFSLMTSDGQHLPALIQESPI